MSFSLAATTAQTAQPTNEVIVELDSASGAWPSHDQVIGAVTAVNSRSAAAVSSAAAAANAAIAARLQNPTSARYLLTSRIHPDVLAKMSPKDPWQVLHRAIILTYSDNTVADAAEKSIRADRTILKTQRSVLMQFSAGASSSPSPSPAPTPSTMSTVNTTFSSSSWTWPINRLNLVPAWNKVKGTAYVGLLDNGIQVSHPDLTDNYRPQFSWNFGWQNNGVSPGNGIPNYYSGAPTTGTDLDENPYYANSEYPNIAGHGTHTAGIIAGKQNDSLRLSGACQHCSLMLGRISGWSDYYEKLMGVGSYINAGLSWMTTTGAQVVNMSFGDWDPSHQSCATSMIDCVVIDAALQQDVAVVTAAGNAARSPPQFPASYAGVIGVGGVQANAWAFDPWGGSFWVGPQVDYGSQYWENSASKDFVAAPAQNILSTMYTGANWSVGSNPDLNCGSYFYPGTTPLPGYGLCTGTSMAAPYVSGIVALMKSANPTASSLEIKKILKGTALPCTLAGGGVIDTSGRCGAGIPNASEAVSQALGSSSAKNRLTPLFGFYDGTDHDHFYTVFPQMGIAAVWGTLAPRTMDKPSTPWAAPYLPSGVFTSGYGYGAFPGYSDQVAPYVSPRAIASVFTTFVNPAGVGPDLVPLYRYSRSCKDCAPRISHVYSADFSENPTLISAGYLLDGIEGYIFPKSQTAPVSGAVRLCRKYGNSLSGNGWILFREDSGSSGFCATTTQDPFGSSDLVYSGTLYGLDNWIGWVMPLDTPHPICGVTPVQTLAACATTVPVIGDFNGDSKTDILWESATSPWILDLSTSTGSVPGTNLYSNSDHHVVSRAADFDGDGKMDFLWQRAADGAVGMTLMTGTTLTSALLYTESGWTIVGTGDFNGDGKSDILWRHPATGLITMWLMDGNRQNGWAPLYQDPDWTIVGTGDFNGDGMTDILWRNSVSGQVTMWLMDGLTVKAWALLFTDPNWYVAGTGDFNGDGKSDILWKHPSDGMFTMWLMNGSSWIDWGVISTNQTLELVGTGDFDGDGKADILWRNPSGGAVQMWLMNGKTRKGNAQNIYGGGGWKPVGLQ